MRFSISSLQNSISTDAGLSCHDAETKNATMAVGLFNEALGLDRCEVELLSFQFCLEVLEIFNLSILIPLVCDFRMKDLCSKLSDLIGCQV